MPIKTFKEEHKKLEYMTKDAKKIGTGIKPLDRAIESKVVKAVSKRVPKAKIAIKGVTFSPVVGAHIARLKKTYDHTRKKMKK